MSDANGCCIGDIEHTKAPCTLFTGNGECFDFDRIIREAKNNLDEVLALERRKIPELEAMLAKNIYRCSILELLSEQLTK